MRILPVITYLMQLRPLAVTGLALLAPVSPAQIALPLTEPSKLKKLSLEDLMGIEVFSVSRRGEKLSETPASVRVITNDEIRRAGAETLPQALRLASNLQAMQIGPSYWAIGARGMNQTTTTSNKLLVMIDGRSIYSPLVSGTYWDQRDVFLPDVDRIEVISGPGGSAWGANAVNGVINIMTKNSADTVGGLVYGGAGIEERALFGARYGGTLGRTGHYRVYAKHLDFDDSVRPNGADSQNRWVLSQVGFRTDHVFGPSELMLQGDLHTGWVQQPTTSSGEYDGGSLQARWQHRFSPDSHVTAQAYYDSARRGAPNTLADRIDILDVDVQHELSWQPRRHRLVWGVSHRISDDQVRNLASQAFIPADFTHRLYTAFVHDEFDLVADTLRLTLGTKFEYNNYSGSDHQPNVRLAWFPAPHQIVWGAVSRAVRTPSRVDRDIAIPATPPFQALGGQSFGSEKLHAYEVGWRGRLLGRTTGTLAIYFHDYDGLRTLEPPTPFTFQNGGEARTYGVETFFRHEFSHRFSVSLGYTLLKKDFQLKPWSRDINAGRVEEADPEHQLHLRGSLDFGRGWEFDFGARHVSEVPTLAARVQTDVPAYTELDARLAWSSRRGWEIALIGTNLLDRAHAESGAINNRREIERSVHGRVTWRF